MMKNRLESAAGDLAASCLRVVTNLLYEWEIQEVEQEFRAVILAGLVRIIPELSEGAKHEQR
jgi:hypothetical protein